MLAYPREPIENDLYMRFPKGIEAKTGNGKTHVLKLINNFYRQNQYLQVWNKYLVEKLPTIGLKKPAIEKFIFYQGRSIFSCHIYYGIFVSTCKQEIYQAIKDLQAAGFYIEAKGDIEYCLGVNFDLLQDI